MSSDDSRDHETAVDEKNDVRNLENVKTKERVGGNPRYYEKDGLRTYGDDEDHDHEPPMTVKRAMSLIAMALLWVGSQIPVYLWGGAPPYIYGDIGGADRWTWFVLGYLLALGAVCPFVGSLSDLLGRRYVAIIGASLIILGIIIASTADTMNVFIGGMVFAGAGAGISELTALAATSEMAPTRKRGTYVAALVFTVIPFCPSVMYAQLICYYSTWRYIGVLCGVWNFIALVGIVFFYFPPPRINSLGLTRRQILAEIDWVGGILSVSGLLLFMMGLQWGGYQYNWSNPHTLVPLILGLFLTGCFIIWESKFAKYPMFPGRLKQAPRILALTLVITAISGANFFSVLLFWPTQAYNVYGHDPVQVGLKGIPIGFSILTGAVVVLALLSFLRGHNRALMVFSCCCMTAGIGSLSVADRNNMGTVWGLLVLAGLGIGGIVVPASIITTIICPDDLIATVTALTLSVRVVGGAIGYCVYYNVFVSKFVPAAIYYMGGTMVYKVGILDKGEIESAIRLTGAGLLDRIAELPLIAGNQTAYDLVVLAGQQAYVEAYKWVYWVSIAFGGTSIVAALFLGDIKKYMDDHVAVVIH